MQNLQNYGWDEHFNDLWNAEGFADYIPGRVSADFGGYLKVVTPEECTAELAGKLTYLLDPVNLPKVGDWVALQLGDDNTATIHAVLPRRSEVGRKMAGEKLGKQVLATNIDIAFVVQALDHDFNLARLERYAYQLRSSNIEPIYIFNKADKSSELMKQQSEIEELDVHYIITSTITGQGLEEVQRAIPAGKTAVFLGSSGVGKSTITNKLLGDERQKTAEVRESDSKGRHTTSHRELFILPNGGLVIDTPGIRELQLWGDEDVLADNFQDIEMLSFSCKYNDCGHTTEADCAVRLAIEQGALTASRLETYRKFQQELKLLNAMVITKAELERKQRRKAAAKVHNHPDKSKKYPRILDD